MNPPIRHLEHLAIGFLAWRIVPALHALCRHVIGDGTAIFFGRAQVMAGGFGFGAERETEIGQLMNHRAKLQVEDHLIDSRLTFTILQPRHYFQNVAVAQAVAQGQFGLSYSMERRLGFVDMVDLASAVVRVATEPGHDSATYEITSSEHLSGNDIVDILSRASGTVAVPRQLPLAAALDWLLGRPPTGFAQYVDRELARRD